MIARLVKVRGAAHIAGLISFLILVIALRYLVRLQTSDAIYFATGLILVSYTIETRKMRHAVQSQTRMQVRPLLSVSILGSGAIVHNRGLGPARNIRNNYGWLLPHLAHGDHGDAQMPLPSVDTVDDFSKGRHLITLTYGSLAGAWYRSIFQIDNGTVRPTDDEEIAVPEAEHADRWPASRTQARGR